MLLVRDKACICTFQSTRMLWPLVGPCWWEVGLCSGTLSLSAWCGCDCGLEELLDVLNFLSPWELARSGPTSRFHYLPSVWSWVRNLSHLSLSFPTCPLVHCQKEWDCTSQAYSKCPINGGWMLWNPMEGQGLGVPVSGLRRFLRAFLFQAFVR